MSGSGRRDTCSHTYGAGPVSKAGYAGLDIGLVKAGCFFYQYF